MKLKSIPLALAASCLLTLLPLTAQDSPKEGQKNMPMMKEMMTDKEMMRQMCREMAKDPEAMRTMCQEMMKSEQGMTIMCQEMMKNDKARAMCKRMMDEAPAKTEK